MWNVWCCVLTLHPQYDSDDSDEEEVRLRYLGSKISGRQKRKAARLLDSDSSEGEAGEALATPKSSKALKRETAPEDSIETPPPDTELPAAEHELCVLRCQQDSP